MEEHSDHLCESDGPEREDEEEADHVEFARSPPDGDLGPDPGGESVGRRVGEVVAHLVLAASVTEPGEESPVELEVSLELEHRDEDNVEDVHHQEGEHQRVTVSL